MAIRTWVGRFCVADGRVEEEGPWLGSLIRQRPDEESDELYALVEPATRGSEEYTAQLVDVIGQLYSRDPLSLTGALTRSLKAAHEHLREWNRKSLRGHRVGAGTSCLALRGSDAYLAQVGPSLAYVLSADGEFRRFEAADPGIEHALGLQERFEPHLRRIKLEPGDLVLTASSHLDAVAPPDHIERILRRGADDALPELYLLCRDLDDFALVLLACFVEEEAPPPDYLTKDGASRETTSEPPSVSADMTATGAVATLGVPVGVAPETPRAELAFGAGGEFDLPRRPIIEHVREITRDHAPGPDPGVRLRDGGAGGPRYKRTTGSGIVPQLQVPRLAIFGVLALVLLGLTTWWLLPGSVKESREDRFAALIADARQANAQAQAISDGGMKRELLNTAQTKLADASKIHAENGELAALKADVTAALGVLDAVYEVDGFTPVADLATQVTGELAITHAVTGGGKAFFLDAKGRRVIALSLAGGEAPATIFEEGELAGFATPSKPEQIAWAEQTQSLLIIDDKRQVFAYFPDKGTLPLTVRGADGWGSLGAAAASGGNLYVLDVDGRQVWRYLPGQGGFDSERTGLLDAPNLTDTTELVVGQDVYVLDGELGIRRFVGKDEIAFALAGIDRPLLSPASLSVLPGSNRLIVADRGNKRIVVASAEGEFLRQIVSMSFTDLRAVAVDEGEGILYVLNGDTLLQAPFPP
jgi:serine/threonine protein phosphatase PrpC